MQNHDRRPRPRLSVSGEKRKVISGGDPLAKDKTGEQTREPSGYNRASPTKLGLRSSRIELSPHAQRDSDWHAHVNDEGDELGAEVLNFVPGETLFVSSHSWDAAGAKAFGYTVCWCNRSAAEMDNLGYTPDLVVPSLGANSSSSRRVFHVIKKVSQTRNFMCRSIEPNGDWPPDEASRRGRLR